MPPFRRSRPAAPADETRAQRALDRATGMLRRYQASGLTMVAIEDVLELLGTGPGTPPARQQAPDPRADPLTGAMWAGPPGTSPPA